MPNCWFQSQCETQPCPEPRPWSPLRCRYFRRFTSRDQPLCANLGSWDLFKSGCNTSDISNHSGITRNSPKVSLHKATIVSEILWYPEGIKLPHPSRSHGLWSSSVADWLFVTLKYFWGLCSFVVQVIYERHVCLLLCIVHKHNFAGRQFKTI